MDVRNLWFPQDGTTTHTARSSMALGELKNNILAAIVNIDADSLLKYFVSCWLMSLSQAIMSTYVLNPDRTAKNNSKCALGIE